MKICSVIKSIADNSNKVANSSETLKLNVEQNYSTVEQVAISIQQVSEGAAIEAARAGEYGKGFAVVAEQVRNLSKDSADAAKQIEERVKNIQLQSDQVVGIMSEGVEEVREGARLANTAKESFKNIVSTSDDVGVEIRRIADKIVSMVNDINNVEIMSKNIYDISKKTSGGSHEVAAAIEEQTASLEEMSSYAAILSNMAGELEKIIKQFKI